MIEPKKQKNIIKKIGREKRNFKNTDINFKYFLKLKKIMLYVLCCKKYKGFNSKVKYGKKDIFKIKKNIEHDSEVLESFYRD